MFVDRVYAPHTTRLIHDQNQTEMKLTHDAAPVIKAAYKRPYTQTTKVPSRPYTQFPIINQLGIPKFRKCAPYAEVFQPYFKLLKRQQSKTQQERVKQARY